MINGMEKKKNRSRAVSRSNEYGSSSLINEAFQQKRALAHLYVNLPWP